MSALELVQRITRFLTRARRLHRHRAGEGGRRRRRALRRVGRRLLLPRGARLPRHVPHPQRADPGARAHAVLRPAQELRLDGEGPVAHAGALLGRVAARQPVGQRLLRVHGRARVRRRPLGVGADARLADGAEGRDRRGAGDGGQGLRRAAHLLRHQRHLHREQGHLPDAARAGREAAPRPQLPQERAPRRGALGRAPGLPRLGAQQEIRAVRPGAEEGAARGDPQARRRAGAHPHLLHLRRPALRPRRRSSRRRTSAASR